jgi:hypothetical protein
MAKMTLKYDSTCADCGADLPAGSEARGYKQRGKWIFYGTECHEDTRTSSERRDDAEYAKGVAEADRYLADVKMFGREQADAFELEAERARYNRGEE